MLMISRSPCPLAPVALRWTRSGFTSSTLPLVGCPPSGPLTLARRLVVASKAASNAATSKPAACAAARAAGSGALAVGLADGPTTSKVGTLAGSTSLVAAAAGAPGVAAAAIAGVAAGRLVGVAAVVAVAGVGGATVGLADGWVGVAATVSVT